MPGKGKHRRPKNQRLSRSIAAAGTGGAALAVPLLGATGAHAAIPAQTVSEKAQQTLPVAAKAAARPNAGVRTYTVIAGDCLSAIADRQRVPGGWQRLYDDNRHAIGANPSVIHPGLRLTLGEKTPEPPAGSTAADHSTTGTTGYVLPVTGATIGTGYHVAGNMWASGYHTGVDFVVPSGTTVKAIAAGTVISAGWGGAYGNQVVIRLNDGYYAQYAHLSQFSISVGQTVAPGQQIGLSGATGNVTGPHLHFEIRTTPNYGSDIDPVGYLRQHGVAVI